MSSSTLCARCVQHSQDFPPRAQYMCEKHFNNAKSWPLCCISPTPVPSAITLLHRKRSKRTPRSLELLNFQKSEILVTHVQILMYYSTFIQTKPSQSKSFCDQNGFNNKIHSYAYRLNLQVLSMKSTTKSCRFLIDDQRSTVILRRWIRIDHWYWLYSPVSESALTFDIDRDRSTGSMNRWICVNIWIGLGIISH